MKAKTMMKKKMQQQQQQQQQQKLKQFCRTHCYFGLAWMSDGMVEMILAGAVDGVIIPVVIAIDIVVVVVVVVVVAVGVVARG